MLKQISDSYIPEKTIFVTGSKGKSTTANIISSKLQQVSLFTSPHQLKFNERIKINNKDISDRDINIALQLTEIISKQQNIKLSVFEKILISYVLSSKLNKCKIWVIEPGIGGFNDSTYQLSKLNTNKSVILTSIELEHQNLLGNTKQLICEDKLKLLDKNSILYTPQHLQSLVEQIRQNIKFKVIYTENNEDKNKQNINLANKLLEQYGTQYIQQQNIQKSNVYYSKAHTNESFKQTVLELKQENFIPDIILFSQTKQRQSGYDGLIELLNQFQNSKIIIIPCAFSMDLTKDLTIDKKSLKYSYKLYKDIKNLYPNRVRFIKNYKKLKINNKQNILVTGSSHLPALIQIILSN